MKDIKITVRENLPETNSSSSHSVAIRMDNQVWCKDPLPVAPDGYLYVKGEDFGREWDEFHGPLPKIQYAAALVAGSFEDLSRLEKVICSFTGIKGVIWTWIPEWYESLIKYSSNPEELRWRLADDERGFPEVDHESRDLYLDIFESDETLKTFIFDLGTTLYLGADGEEDDSKRFNYFAKNITEPIGCFRVNLPAPIGRVDIPIRSESFNIQDSFRQHFWGELSIMDDNILPNISFSTNGVPHVGSGDLSFIGVDDSRTKLIWATEDYCLVRSAPFTPKPGEYLEFPFELEMFDKIIPIQE